MSNLGAESLDARLVRFRSRGGVDEAEPLARALLAASRPSEAAEIAAIHANENPASYGAWELLALAKTADRDPVGAQKAWLEAVRRSPTRPEPYRAIVEILLVRGDIDRAEKLTDRGLELAGSDPELERLRAALIAARAALPPGARTSLPSVPPPAGESVRPPAPTVDSAVVPVPTATTSESGSHASPTPAHDAVGARKSVPPVGASIRPRAVIFAQPEPPPRSSAPPANPTSSVSGSGPLPTPPVSKPPSGSAPRPLPGAQKTPVPGAAIRPRAVIFTPQPPPAAILATATPKAEAPTPASLATEPPEIDGDVVATPRPSAPAPHKPPSSGAAIRPRAVIFSPPVATPTPSPRPFAPAPGSLLAQPTPALGTLSPTAAPVPVQAPAPAALPQGISVTPSAPGATKLPSIPPLRGPQHAPRPSAPPPNPPPEEPEDDSHISFDANGIPEVRGLTTRTTSSKSRPSPEDAKTRISTIPKAPAVPRISAPPHIVVPPFDLPEAAVVPVRPSAPPAPPEAPTPFFPETTPEEQAAVVRTFTDGESTKVTRREDIVALENIGAIRPNAVQSGPAAGVLDLVEDDAETPDVDVDVVVPLATGGRSGRVRDDATVPYSTNEARDIAERLIPILPSNPPDESGANASNRPTTPHEPSDMRETVAATAPKRTRWVVGFGLVAVLGLGAFGLSVRNRREASARLTRLESGLLDASPTGVRDALDAAALTNAITTPLHRDVRLEANLVRAVEAGGVSADAVRGSAVTARARGVAPEWAHLATATEAYAAGDRALTERALGTANVVDPRAGLVRARLELAVGHVEAARVVLAQTARLVPESVAVQLALSDVDRAAGHDEEAARRLDALVARHATHARLLAARASIALDANATVDLARLVASERTLHGATAAERASFDAVLGRARARAGSAVDPTRLSALVGVRLAPHVALDVAAYQLEVDDAEGARARLVDAFGESPVNRRARMLLARSLADLGRGAEALALLGDAAGDLLEVRARASLHATAADAREAAAVIAELGTNASPALLSLEIRLRLAAGDDAVALMPRAATLHQEHPTDRDALIAFAACASATGQWDQLTSSVDESLRADPQVAAWLARAAMRRGELPAVEAALSTLEARAADSADTLLIRAFVHAEKGEFDPALVTYALLGTRDDVLLEGPAKVVASAGAITTLLAAGRLADARQTYADLDDASRAHPALALAAAKLATADGRADEAIAWLEARASASTATPDILLAYGDALFATNHIDRASEVYREAVELDGTLPEAQLGIAVVLIRSERFDDATTQLVRCRRALDGRPRGASVEGRYYALLGRTLLGKHEIEEARFALRRAVQQAGAPPEAYFFLGESLAGANSPDSRAAYERYLALDPNGMFAGRARRAIR